MTLLDEIRNLVQPQDLDRFDNLRERREVSVVLSQLQVKFWMGVGWDVGSDNIR